MCFALVSRPYAVQQTRRASCETRNGLSRSTREHVAFAVRDCLPECGLQAGVAEKGMTAGSAGAPNHGGEPMPGISESSGQGGRTVATSSLLRAIHACCTCSVGSIAMHAQPASQFELSERRRRLVPVAAFSLSNQADQVRFEAHRRFVRCAG
jgi:hypothetical protein